MKNVFASALFALTATSVFAESPALSITDAYAFETTALAKSGAGYLTITNTGDAADRLMGVSADFPRVMLHTTEMSDGVTKMKHLMGVTVPAGETVMFEPGAMHVMFMGLAEPFAVGAEIPATLTFRDAGEIDVTFTVTERR